MHPAEKINAGGERSDGNLVRMQLEAQFVPEVLPYPWNEQLEPTTVMRQDGEIIGITKVAYRLQPVLHELIKL